MFVKQWRKDRTTSEVFKSTRDGFVLVSIFPYKIEYIE